MKCKGCENFIEIETFVNSIDISDNQGKEIVLIVETDIQNNRTFYTDSNGLELQERILNYRDDYTINMTGF